jgi:sn-glycerol 3-phosphate transport system permease protein
MARHSGNVPKLGTYPPVRRWPLQRLRAGVTRTRSAGLGPWLVLPALALLVVFVARPVVRTVQLSGYASDLIGNPTRYVGLGNYRELLGDPTFARTVFVSLAIALLGMALATSVALLAALLLRSRLPGGGLFAVVLSLPFAYSAASASAVFAGLFAPSVGVLNLLLGRVGVNGPAWLANPVAAVWAIAVSTAWYEFGFAFLVLTAAVGDVAPEILEAARLDGAGETRLATTVIVPIIRPSILFLTVTQTISGLQTFAQIQVLTRGGPAGATTNFVYRLYQLAFGNATADFGRASVIAVVLIVLIAAITFMQFRVFGRDRTA